MRTLDLPEALEAAGVTVRLLDGWDTVHVINNRPYDWRESPKDPAGAMWHHTATASYTPNRDKANAYAGLANEGKDRLYQSAFEPNFPVYTIANAYPAPISSGYGVRSVLDDFVKQDVAFRGRQRAPDDNWAGNTHYWNTEVILDGTGGEMDQRVWDMNVKVAQVMNDLFGWSSARHIGHAMHTRRKIDLRDGRYPDMAATIDAFRIDINKEPPVEEPVDYDKIREIVKEEVEAALGGKPITMPDGVRTGNQGVVNSVLWAETHGSTIWEQIHKASECGDE